MTQNCADTLFARAQQVIPGGVNSPVRAFNAVGGTPVYIRDAAGACMTTVNGEKLIDFCGSWGPLILGHAHHSVVKAITDAAGRGSSYGTNCAEEVAFCELLISAISGADQIRLVNSGTEAVMTALRLARGFTGRRKILKFDGCYHGHADHMLVSAGSGLLTGGMASSAGIPPSIAAEVLVAPYNDIAAARQLVDAWGTDLAAIIVEPVAGNMGLVLPEEEFLGGLREISMICGSLLIFDEVITGFRLAPTTYGSHVGITPDLLCLGKIIGGGLPVGAVAGKREIMCRLAPQGDVYQAGTLSGNPVVIAAGHATIQSLVARPPYEHIGQLAKRLANGITQAAEESDVEIHVNTEGGMFTVFFQQGPVRNLADARKSDTGAYARFFHGMLDQGIYLPPSQFETAFISAAHKEIEIEMFIDAARKVFQKRTNR
jgi:glutamate-1-semialdehyde 2,1-aminomutase